jgi:ketosteroid isomerase-like protein
MKLNRLFPSLALPHAPGAVFAGLAALAVAALCTSVPVQRVQAGQEFRHLEAIAELDQLLADFHGALSYGGDINAMMALWADDSTLTLNGTAHVGKPAIQAFFQASGYFLNNWVSLAPEYKTQIVVDGDRATASAQCVATDISVNPPVVRSVIQVNATMERRHGRWFYTSMDNTTPAPL